MSNAGSSAAPSMPNSTSPTPSPSPPPPTSPSPLSVPHPLPPTHASPLATPPPPSAGPIQPQTHPHRATPRHPGGWLPKRHNSLETWLEHFIADAKSSSHSAPAKWHPVIKEVAHCIDVDPILRLGLTNMIEQVPRHKPYVKRHINDPHGLLTAINHVIHTAPHYDTTELVGAPLNAVLDFMMDTPAGYALFRSPSFNKLLKKMLQAWCDFLHSPASAYTLHAKKGGWLCDEAMAQMKMDDFHHDPQHPTLGFTSWNDFFTRRFLPHVRPVELPDDDKVIVSACESTPYAIAFKAARQAQFWIKSQPYSLGDMLGHDDRVAQFEGGCVYQAFLSALFYHRWHSPVNGTVVDLRNIDGTYYSEAETEGFDPAGPNNSQGYITHTAARALMFIQCDDPVIGLMAIMFVGMAEISSCVFAPEVQKGARIVKGQEIGYFQYGGSTHCLIFRKGVIHSVMAKAIPQGNFGEGPPAVRLSEAIMRAN